METDFTPELPPDPNYLSKLDATKTALLEQAKERGINTNNLIIPINPEQIEKLHLQMQEVLHPNTEKPQPVPWDEQPILMLYNNTLVTRTLLNPNNHRLAEEIFPKQIDFLDQTPWITYDSNSTQSKQPLSSFLPDQHKYPTSALAGIAKIKNSPSYYNQMMAWRLLFLTQNFQNTTETPDHLTIFTTVRLANELEKHKPAAFRLQQFAQQMNLPINFIGQVDRPFPTALAVINLPSAQIPKIQNTLWETLSTP